MDPQQLQVALADACFAFRGYNVTNLGRSLELLEHPAYRGLVESRLGEASAAASDILGRPVDLADRVRRGEDTTLATYDEAIALILAMSCAQVDSLSAVHGIDLHGARLLKGYSLGEIGALVCSGRISLADALRVPLSLAADCVALADGVELGVLFSRADVLDQTEVLRVCQEVNLKGQGVVGISANLSPNSYLLMGQRGTLRQFKTLGKDLLHARFQIRLNHQQWPPLHTPIVWQRQVPDRAADLMHRLPVSNETKHPPILSLVTGDASYTPVNVRAMIRVWIDSPQRLWDAVYGCLSGGIETIVHVGPEPNIIPATYRRLSENVEVQTRGRIGMQALLTMAQRPWLKSLLPKRTALLRAPIIKHVILEDWLLEHAPASDP